MMHLLQVVAVVLVALAMSTAVAHALELPGKRRLGREAYLSVQSIYYPGFTVAGGFGEVGGLVLTVAVTLLTPAGAPAFWLSLLALCGMVGMQAIFWAVTQPVNRYWLQGQALGAAGARFFGVTGTGTEQAGRGTPDWRALRNRWEYSHLARAGLATISFLALLTAATVAS